MGSADHNVHIETLHRTSLWHSNPLAIMSSLSLLPGNLWCIVCQILKLSQVFYCVTYVGLKAHCGLAQIYHGRQYVPSRRVKFWWNPSRISRCDQGYETFFTLWQGFLRMKRGCQQHWSTLSMVVHMKLWCIVLCSKTWDPLFGE